jgi:hypothetical protein
MTAGFEAMMLPDRANYVMYKDSAYEDSSQLRLLPDSQSCLAYQERW